jgi:hypothetical protein
MLHPLLYLSSTPTLSTSIWTEHYLPYDKLTWPTRLRSIEGSRSLVGAVIFGATLPVPDNLTPKKGRMSKAIKRP